MRKSNKPHCVALTCDRIDISWPGITDAVEYRIYRSSIRKPVALVDRNLIAVTRTTHYQDRELRPDTKYHYAMWPWGENQERRVYVLSPARHCEKVLF